MSMLMVHPDPHEGLDRRVGQRHETAPVGKEILPGQRRTREGSMHDFDDGIVDPLGALSRSLWHQQEPQETSVYQRVGRILCRAGSFSGGPFTARILPTPEGSPQHIAELAKAKPAGKVPFSSESSTSAHQPEQLTSQCSGDSSEATAPEQPEGSTALRAKPCEA
eukprot:scaffold8456_cov210-Pinguiococcus_pyrenoidosus.AAC.3